MKIYLDNNLGVANVEQEELTQDTIGYNILKVYIPNAVLTPYDTFTCYYGALLQNGRKVGWFAMEARTSSDADYEANYTLYKATLEQCIVSVEGKVYIGCQVLLGNSGNATLIKKNTAVVQFNVRKSVAINNDILVLDTDQTTTDVLESYKNLLKNALTTYATKATTYTKTEVDGKLDLKADKSTTYTKTETDTLLNAKVDDVYKCIGKIYANKDVSYSTSSSYPSSNFDEPIPAGTNILIHYNLPIDSNGHQFSFKDVNNQNVNTYIYYNNEGWLLLKFDVDVYGIGFWVNSLTSGSGYYKVYTYKDLLNQDLENDENVLYEGKITITFPSYTLYRPILAHTKIILNWDDMAIDGNNHGMSFVDANNNRVLTYVFIENNGSKEFEFDVDIVKLEFGMNNYSSHNCLWNISKYTINGNIQNNIKKIDGINDLLFKTPKNKPIIVDTDFSADVDDCVALRLLCWGADMKLVNIRGVVADNYTNIVAPTIDGFMKYYGHPTDVGYDVTKFNQKTSSYQNWIYNNTTHKYDTTDEYPDAVKVYRKQLAKTQDKITIVSLGFLTNLRRLLESQSDGYSSLNGVELVTEKVECIYIMGGIINTSLTLEDEYNFKYDIDSAKYVIDNCPVPIVYFSQNIGLVKCGQNLKDIYASINDDLVYHAYYDYTQAQGEDVINNGRYCWDGMLMYLAMIGDLDYCGYRVIKGSYHIDNNNYGIFTLSSNGNQYNLIKTKNTEFYQKQINTKIF